MKESRTDLGRYRLRLAGAVVVIFAVSIVALAFCSQAESDAQLQAQSEDLMDYMPNGAKFQINQVADPLNLKQSGFELVGSNANGKILSYSFAGDNTQAQEILNRIGLPQGWMYYVVPLEVGCTVVLQTL